MDLTSLESPLREKVQEYLDANPKGSRVFAVLLEKRAAAIDPAERAQIDKSIAFLLKPTKNSGWIFGGLIALFVAGVLGFALWSHFRHVTNVEDGEPVVAKVTRLERGDCLFGQQGNRCLQLELELHPQGRSVYSARVTHDLPLEWTARVQPGSWITVAVDRADPNKVYFDEESLSVEAPKPLP